MKIKTTELIGLTLTWGVVIADGWEAVRKGKYGYVETEFFLQRQTKCGGIQRKIFSETGYHSWDGFGRIIERECISLDHMPGRSPQTRWRASVLMRGVNGLTLVGDAYGPDPLIASMRCFVLSKLGEVIDVPDELCCTNPYKEPT